MAAVVRITQDSAALKALVASRDGPVGQDLIRRANLVVNRAKQLCPVDKGRLRASITWELVVGGQQWPLVARVGTNVEYARYVHDGTGIYGPRGAPIRPVRAQWLVFTPRGSNSPVFARQVRGVRGRPFLTDALPVALTA